MAKQVHNATVPPAGIIDPNVNYAGQASDGSDLNDLDLVARYILAVTHSRWNSEFTEEGEAKGAKEYEWADGPRPEAMTSHVIRQNVTGMKTFAVAVSGSTLYVAHNAGTKSKKPEPSTDDREEISAAVLGYLASCRLDKKVTSVEIINRATSRKLATTYHAEMQLLAHFIAGGLCLDGKVIGVSKPCCSTCSNQLDALNVSYSLKGDPPLGEWKIPQGALTGMLSANALYPLG
jgi:hypothetical protein